MHNQHHIFHYLKNRELNELYFSIAIRSFSLAMIGIFIPIFLLQIGFSLAQVLIFFAIFAFTHSVGSFPAAKIAAKYGFKHSILFSIPFLIVALLMLYTIEIYGWPIYLIAIIFGINNSLFWIGYHTDFAKFSEKKKRGTQLGSAKIITSIFQVLGPVIGGLILVFVGFKVLFIVSSILLFVATIPLFYSKDSHSPNKFTFRGIFRGRKIKDSLSFIGFGFDNAMGNIVWPIFIFFVVLGEQYTLLGTITSLSLFFSLIFVYIIGKFSDVHRRFVLRIGSIFTTAVWVGRYFVRTVAQVFVIDSLYGVSRSLTNIPFDALSYDKADKGDIIRFITYREFVINLGRTFLLLILLLVSDLILGLTVGGGVGSLLMLLF